MAADALPVPSPEEAPPSRRFHFLSGLPRSGSTLLAALLGQNPRFRTGMSSPVAGLVHALLGEMSARNEFSVFFTDAQRQRLLRSVFTQYYADAPQPVVVDTNRSWCARMDLLAQLFPQARVIACVREVSWIVDSIERLVRRNVFQPSILFQFQAGGTVYTRANALAAPDGLIGHAYDALKQAFYGTHSERLMLVQYESLVADPERVLAAIYDFLEEAPFAHDVEHIAFDAADYDAQAGTPGLHTVRPRIAAEPRETLLPPDLFRRFANDAFWKDPKNHPRGVRIV